MKPLTRGSIVWLAASLVLVAASAAFLYFEWWVPNSKLRDLKWYDTAGKQELKATAQQALIIPFPGPHDAFLVLIREGDADSIPYLLWALRWQPDTKGVMTCTKAHCIKALERITGHKAGCNYQDWATWWEATGRHLPPASFPLNEEL